MPFSLNGQKKIVVVVTHEVFLNHQIQSSDISYHQKTCWGFVDLQALWNESRIAQAGVDTNAQINDFQETESRIKEVIQSFQISNYICYVFLMNHTEKYILEIHSN